MQEKMAEKFSVTTDQLSSDKVSNLASEETGIHGVSD